MGGSGVQERLVWERHGQSPILHEPVEFPNLGRGLSEQLSAQGMATLNVVTTESLRAGMNISSAWISRCYSQQIVLARYLGEGNGTELTSSRVAQKASSPGRLLPR